MQKFIFEIRSRGFFLLVIAFLIISGLVYAEITEQFDESSILHFQSVSGNTSLDHFDVGFDRNWWNNPNHALLFCNVCMAKN